MRNVLHVLVLFEHVDDFEITVVQLSLKKNNLDQFWDEKINVNVRETKRDGLISFFYTGSNNNVCG